jgi:hypothetical protein
VKRCYDRARKYPLTVLDQARLAVGCGGDSNFGCDEPWIMARRFCSTEQAMCPFWIPEMEEEARGRPQNKAIVGSHGQCSTHCIDSRLGLTEKRIQPG